MKKNIIKNILIITITLVVCSALISLTYFFANKVIVNNQLKRENEKVANLYPNANLEKLTNKLNAEDLEKGLISIIKADDVFVYTAKITGFSDEYYIFLISIDKDGNFKDFLIIESDDNDYRQNIENDDYINRFLNKNYLTEFVDGVSGATRSSKPISIAIKQAAKNYERIKND